MKRFAAFALSFLLIASSAFSAMPGDDVNALIHMPLPERLDIGGEPVPLDREDVAERLEYELLIMLGNPVQTALWLKRFPRVMPEIEREIAARGLPDDLKYVAVIESSLRAESVSSAGAVGPWQFMAATGREYGLNRENWVDERRNWTLSTRAALDFLKDLHERTNSWSLVLAMYNAGPGRVRQAMENQKNDEFYGLVLPEETERYVFRFLAAKAILTNPQLYGIDLTGARLYGDRSARPVTVEVRRSRMPLLALSKAAGLSYRYFLRLNPSYVGGELPKGIHTVYIPADRIDQFSRNVDAWKKANPEAPPAPVVAKKEQKPQKPAPVIAAAPPPAPTPANPVLTAATPAAVQPAAQPPADVAASLNAPAQPAAADAQTAAATQLAASAPDAAVSDDVAFPIQKEGVVSYIVRKGDTLSAIARRFNITIEKLRAQNGMGDSSALQTGQTLVVVPKPE